MTAATTGVLRFTCFTARSNSTSAFAYLFANPRLWSAVALSLLLQVAVVHVPFLNIAFGTAPLSFDQWLVCAAMARVVLTYSELEKAAAASLGSMKHALRHRGGHRCSQP